MTTTASASGDSATVRFVPEPQLVPLTRLFTEVAPAYGDTWADAIQSLIDDPAEFDVIETLTHQLHTSSAGCFTRPVRIDSREKETDDGEEPLKPADDTRWRVGNGMHRVTATVLAGHDHILVDGTFDEVAEDRELEVRFTLDHTHATTPAPPWGTDHPDLDFTFWLRSFPLPDGSWAEQCFAGTTGRVVECVYLCKPDQVDALLAGIAARCAQHHVGITMVDHVLRPADYWETIDLD